MGIIKVFSWILILKTVGLGLSERSGKSSFVKPLAMKCMKKSHSYESQRFEQLKIIINKFIRTKTRMEFQPILVLIRSFIACQFFRGEGEGGGLLYLQYKYLEVYFWELNHSLIDNQVGKVTPILLSKWLIHLYIILPTLNRRQTPSLIYWDYKIQKCCQN